MHWHPANDSLLHRTPSEQPYTQQAPDTQRATQRATRHPAENSQLHRAHSERPSTSKDTQRATRHPVRDQARSEKPGTQRATVHYTRLATGHPTISRPLHRAQSGGPSEQRSLNRTHSDRSSTAPKTKRSNVHCTEDLASGCSLQMRPSE